MVRYTFTATGNGEKCCRCNHVLAKGQRLAAILGGPDHLVWCDSCIRELEALQKGLKEAQPVEKSEKTPPENPDIGVWGSILSEAFFKTLEPSNNMGESTLETLLRGICVTENGQRLVQAMVADMEKKYAAVHEQFKNPDNVANASTLTHWRRVIRFVRDHAHRAFPKNAPKALEEAK